MRHLRRPWAISSRPQLALLELLRGQEDHPDGAISLELHDDVAWEEDGRPVELLQVKHHIRSVRSLGDKEAYSARF